MSDRDLLQRIADAIVRRVVKEHPHDAPAALRRAYPFGDSPEGIEIWIESLKRHGVEVSSATPRRSGRPAKRPGDDTAESA